jgi:hypothetical protein
MVEHCFFCSLSVPECISRDGGCGVCRISLYMHAWRPCLKFTNRHTTRATPHLKHCASSIRHTQVCRARLDGDKRVGNLSRNSKKDSNSHKLGSHIASTLGLVIFCLGRKDTNKRRTDTEGPQLQSGAESAEAIELKLKQRAPKTIFAKHLFATSAFR